MHDFELEDFGCALKKYYLDNKIWSELPFRISEIIVGLVLAAIGSYIFIINFTIILQKGIIFFDAIIIPIKLIILAIPGFIGFIIIDAGASGKDPVYVAQRNLKILLLSSLVFTVAIATGLSMLEIAPQRFYISSEISLGDLLAPLAILVSIATISYGWFKDQQQRRKEYADKIRSAAGTILAMMERRNSMNEQFFENIKPLLFDSVLFIIKEGDTEQASDSLQKGIIKESMSVYQRRLEEPLEESFKDLYGYDSNLQKAFAYTINELKIIEGYLYISALVLFQMEIYSVRAPILPYEENLEILQRSNNNPNYEKISKNDLMGDLLNIVAMLSYEQKDLVDAIISSFKQPLLNIIKSDDDQIFDKSIDLSMPPLDEFWKPALEGLEFCAQRKFWDSITSFNQAIEKDRDKSIAGLWAARSLAHLGCLDRAKWKSDAEEAINKIYKIKYNI